MGILHKVEKVLKKQSFCHELKSDFYMYSAADLVMFLGDFSRHGRHIDGFVEVH